MPQNNTTTDIGNILRLLPSRAVSVHEPEETISVPRRQGYLILQVRQIEHRLVRHVRPVQQVGIPPAWSRSGRQDEIRVRIFSACLPIVVKSKRQFPAVCGGPPA